MKNVNFFHVSSVQGHYQSHKAQELHQEIMQ